MKTIIRPARAEKVQYHCDVTSVPLEHGPVATITLHCGYGAPYDGDTFVIDLSMDAAEIVIPLLRTLLLDGGPLGPHRTDSLLPAAHPEKEKRISRQEGTRLLRELERLRRHRRRVGAAVVQNLAKSSGAPRRRNAKKAVDRASVRGAGVDQNTGGKIRNMRKGRRMRALLPEYEAMMAKPAGNDSAADLDAIRGDR